jgi:penicillin-binding protein 2
MRIYEDLRSVQVRVERLQYGALVVFALLIASFWHIQVLRGKHYRMLAENNQNRTVPIAAPRGVVLDRHGRVLVENRPAFNIVLRPEDCPDIERALGRISALLDVKTTTVSDQLARRPARFRPVPVKTNASEQDVAVVEARRFELPELAVDPIPLRSYPLGGAAAHVLGRVGEVTERQLSSPDFAGIQPGDIVGQAGIEVYYNSRLMGENGYRRLIVNSRGVEVRQDRHQLAQEGPRVELTLDADLQAALEAAFVGRTGSAVLLDPTNGDVLALVSTPAFNPNDFAVGIDAQLWHKLVSDPDTPLMNKVIQGQYAPGSVFKIVIATAALEEGLITPETTFYCPGELAIYGTVFRCNRAGGHGRLDLKHALAQSCNTYFYQLGIKLEIDRIARYAQLFGLGATTNIDLPGETPGLVPSSAWKLKTQKTPWYPGETVSVAIGQGQVSVTPLQLARVAAIVANGGRFVSPRLIRSIGGQVVERSAPRDLGFKPENLAAVRGGMEAVVNEGGTGRRARLQGIAVCGKTGSAQVVAHARLVRSGNAEEYLPHAWFVGFAPAENPAVAFAFLVEHGGSGAESAAPVAREVLAHFFNRSRPVVADGRRPE